MAQRLLELDKIPWLPTDVLRTVLRRVLPELDAIDQDPVDAALLAEFMYPHVEQAAEVCAEEAACFLIEGFDLSPSYLPRLRAALEQTEVRGCFLGHGSFSVEDLAGYRGPKPQHRGPAPVELREAAAWIRRRSGQLREECAVAGVAYVDVGELGLRPPCSRPGACCLAAVKSPVGAADGRPSPHSSPWLPEGYVQNFRQAALKAAPVRTGGCCWRRGRGGAAAFCGRPVTCTDTRRVCG